MKQRFQYIVLAITLPILFRLPQYRTYAYLTDESVEPLQDKIDRIAKLRRLNRQYNDHFTQLNFFGVAGLLPGHEEEMMAKLVHPAITIQEELKMVEVEEDIIEILLAYHQLKKAVSH